MDRVVLGEYEYNALHWRTVKRARSPGAGSLDEMRLMYYSANWQLLEERIDRSWTSGFTEDERAQTFWGKRYIDDAVARRRDRDANGTFDDSFFYVTDAQFSTVAMAKPNGGIVERITYDSYGKARHHFGADVTGDGATTSADGTAIQNAYGESIGDAGYKAEYDLDRDGNIDSDDYNAAVALSGGVTQSALASGMVSFVTTGSGGSARHGPDNPIAWDGYVFNTETGQYHVRNRWYDMVLARWLERDPEEYIDGMNLYQLVSGQPTSHTDPLGLGPIGWYLDACRQAFGLPRQHTPVLDAWEEGFGEGFVEGACGVGEGIVEIPLTIVDGVGIAADAAGTYFGMPLHYDPLSQSGKSAVACDDACAETIDRLKNAGLTVITLGGYPIVTAAIDFAETGDGRAFGRTMGTSAVCFSMAACGAASVPARGAIGVTKGQGPFGTHIVYGVRTSSCAELNWYHQPASCAAQYRCLSTPKGYFSYFEFPVRNPGAIEAFGQSGNVTANCLTAAAKAIAEGCSKPE